MGFLFRKKAGFRGCFCAINTTSGATVELADGAAVAANAKFVVSLSDAVDADTVNSSTVKLYKDGALVAKSVALNADKNEITVTPSLVLDQSSTYKLVVDGVKTSEEVALESYSQEFSVASNVVVVTNQYVDGGVTTPMPKSKVIDSGSVTFATNDSFEFIVQKSLDSNTVNTTNVKLKNLDTGAFIAPQLVLYTEATKTISFVLDSTLAEGEYEVVLNNVKGLDGSSLDTYSLVFNLANPAVVYTPQGVVAGNANLYNKLEGALLQGTYYNGFKAQYTANMALDTATINGDTVQLYKDKDGVETLVDSTISFSGGMITVTPSADLEADSSFVVKFDGIKDENGIELSASQDTFTTGDYTPASIVSVTPEVGSEVDPASAKFTIKFSETVETASPAFKLGAANDFSADDTVILYDTATKAAVNISSGTKTWNTDRDELTLDLTGLVTPGKTYTLKVAGSKDGTGFVKSDAGQIKNMVNTYSQTFTTTADGAKPTVSTVKGSFTGQQVTDKGTYVVNGSSNVAIDEDITIKFNDKDLSAIGSTPLTAASDVRLYDITSGTPVAVTGINYTINNNGSLADTLVIEAGANNLSVDSKYRLVLTDGVEDLTGNGMTEVSYEFTTGQGPTTLTAATSLSATPAAFPVANSIEVNANEAVKASTVTKDSVKVVNVTTGAEVEGTVTVTGTLISFNPSKDLDGESDYKLVISPSVTDLAGNKLYSAATGDSSVSREFTFSTEDTIAPTVTATSIVNGASNVDLASNVKFTFSEKVVLDDTAVGATQALTSNGAGAFALGTLADFNNNGTIDTPVSFTVSATGGLTTTGATEYTINPDTDLVANTQYVLVALGDNVNTNQVGLTDVNDNAMETSYVLNFTTGTTATDSIKPAFADAISIEANNATPNDVTATNGIYNVASTTIANNIAFKFDENINVSDATVTMYDVTNDKNFEVLSTAKVANQYIDVNPLVSLTANTLYKVTIKGVKDAGGNLADDVVVYIQVAS